MSVAGFYTTRGWLEGFTPALSAALARARIDLYRVPPFGAARTDVTLELDADGPADAPRRTAAAFAGVTGVEPHNEFPEPVHMWVVHSGDGPAISEAERAVLL